MNMVHKILCVYFLGILFFETLHAQNEYLQTQTPALFGSVTLAKGFPDVEHQVQVVTKTSVNIQHLNFCVGCSGFLSDVAVLDLQWEGETDQLHIHFEPDKNNSGLSMAILTPNNEWLYGIQNEGPETGPVLYLYGYNSGRYKIFIGGQNEGDTLSGKITISEFSPNSDINDKKVLKLDAPYVPTPKAVVDTMLSMVKLGADDYIIDLGSGDGRIVIEAAAKGAYGYGIDLDPQRVEEAWENATLAGVTDRVSFIEGNVFDADLSMASVVSMYLSDSINVSLRPRLFEQLKPGTRIVSHAFKMGEWEPDNFWKEGCIFVYSWVIPARVEGSWSWVLHGENFRMDIRQKFQKLEISAYIDKKLMLVQDPVLTGSAIGFTLIHPKNGTRYTFYGLVENEKIKGSVKLHKDGESSEFLWQASR
jgi:precorrin-6B methylase 2